MGHHKPSEHLLIEDQVRVLRIRFHSIFKGRERALSMGWAVQREAGQELQVPIGTQPQTGVQLLFQLQVRT